MSEQTAKARSGIVVCAVHSRSVWDSREMDGTQNRMNARPLFSLAVRSAIFSEVKVLPVPHAMISLPRSLPTPKPANTLSTALC
ncbi:Uncharacterised protein [Mycobacteroides abscessus subsp. abscessus]|nr:Uncharacterised protein [Mycobacteroides abscessus subsp. abscessus]